MGTRALIIFVNNAKRQVVTYRHWDGYPEAVLPELKEFLKWNGGRNQDFDYAIANYFYYMKKTRVEASKNDTHADGTKFTDKEIKEYHELTGFGLCEKHEDMGQAHEYYVNLDTEEVRQQ